MPESEATHSAPKKAPKTRRWILRQPPMTRVLMAGAPAAAAAIYLFGWRALVLLAIVSLVGLLCEGAFTWPKGKPATQAVFVTCVLYTLTLPPTIPFGIAVVGVAFGVVFGKMAFGGMGANVFNPALVGRCFVYICFPLHMTNRWAPPATANGLAAGLARWGVDAVSMATPLDAYKPGESIDYWRLFVGNVGGSLGETSALLILIGGCYLLLKKVASWQIVAGCAVGSLVAGGILHLVDAESVGDPLFQLLAGGFLFGAFFMATDPVSAAKTPAGKWIYGLLIGALTIVLRGYSNFSCGLMFSILIGNMFAPLIDAGVKEYQGTRKAQAAQSKGSAASDAHQ